MVAVLLKSSLLPPLLLFVLARGEDTDGADLDTPGQIQKHGYPVEEHKVTTQDGYILTMFRIPHGKDSNASAGEPVALHHGLGSSSDAWLQQGDNSLPFKLADTGHDTFLLNGRGNIYSREHVTLEPNNSAYWNYSWHEQGVHDLPAMIDKIRNVTGKSSLSYVGHSMGTTIFNVMGSERPGFLRYLRMVFLLAPVAFMGHVPSPLVRAGCPLAVILAYPLFLLFHGEVPDIPLPTQESANESVAQVMDMFASMAAGGNSPGDTSSDSARQRRGVISGVSVKQGVHYCQEVLSWHFRQYDHGLPRNVKTYGEIFPPDYSLRINSTVCALYANADALVGIEDVDRLAKATPPSYQFCLVQEDGFNHMDFVASETAPVVVYERILTALRNGRCDSGCSKDIRATVGPSARRPAATGRVRPEKRRSKKVQKAGRKRTAARGGSSPLRRAGSR